MPLIRPFRGLRVVTEYAQDVIAPPYDVLNRQQAIEYADDNPLSFLHISKPEIDLDANVDPYSEAVYQKGLETLESFVIKGIFHQDPEPCYYLYQLVEGEHCQTGVMAVVSVDAYENNRVRKHELTRPEKEQDRATHMAMLKTQTEPVMLAYPNNPDLAALLEKLSTEAPLFEAKTKDNVAHRLWKISNPVNVQALTDNFENLEALYIADGHHRSAASACVAKQRGDYQDAKHGYFISVMFPSDNMQVLGYHRAIKDLNGHDKTSLLAAITKHFTVTPVDNVVTPIQAGQYGLYIESQWYRLTIAPEYMGNDDPLKCLDVTLLSEHLLQPLLNINDPRTDKRITCLGGNEGVQRIVELVDAGEMALGLVLFPTQLHQLFQVADADKVMPPKSTWFSPKLADGLVLHFID